MWHFWQNKIIFLVSRRKNQVSPFFVSLEKWWWLHLKTILSTLMVDDMQQWVHRVVYEGKPRQTCNAEMCKNNFPQGRIMLSILILRQVYDSIHPHTYSEWKSGYSTKRTACVSCNAGWFTLPWVTKPYGDKAICSLSSLQSFFPIIAAWRPFHGKFIGSSADILLMAYHMIPT